MGCASGPRSRIQGRVATFHLKQKIFINENLHASDKTILENESQSDGQRARPRSERRCATPHPGATPSAAQERTRHDHVALPGVEGRGNSSSFAIEFASGSACGYWPVGLMDKASASGAGDSRFESWAGHLMQSSSNRLHRLLRSASMTAATAKTFPYRRLP